MLQGEFVYARSNGGTFADSQERKVKEEREMKKKKEEKSSTLAYQSKEIRNRKTKLPPLPCDKRRRRYLTLHAHT